MPKRCQNSTAKCPFSCKEDLPKNWVTTTSQRCKKPTLLLSSYLRVFGVREDWGLRLKRAGSHGKLFPRDPARLNLTSNLLSPQKHINSYWVRVCKKPTSSWRSSLKNVDGRNNSQHCWANNVGSCCARVGRSIQTEATTPNNADRTTWKLTQQDINTTHTERDCSRRKLFRHFCGSSVRRNRRRICLFAVCYAVLMSHNPALFWVFFGVVLMSFEVNQLCRIQCVYFVYFCWSGQVIFVSPQPISI